MKFNSYEFLLLFLPLTLAVYFLLGRSGRRQAALAWLVAASLGFYAYWSPAYLGLILGSILFNYTLGGYIARARHKGNGRFLMLLGVASNLAVLGYYKYFNFFVESVNTVVGTAWQVEWILLPLAISFFTFQQIAYLVDVWKGEAQDYSFLHYCLFVSFFPQLIAGPIVHHKEMMPQFDEVRRFAPHLDNFAVGISIFIIGLAKKTLIADELAMYADPVFTAADTGFEVSFIEAWGGVLAYTFQIYFDFSGYSDMAIGLARLFGVHLPLNFFSPYRATSIIDFWRRWHMTLSRFLRDYVYIPLGGNRKGTPRRLANVMTTMLLGGLWHGAGWNFVIWGALHGAYLMLNQGWRAAFPGAGNNMAVRLTSWLITFLSVALAWTFFRAETFNGAWTLVNAMAGRGAILLPDTYISALAPLSPVFKVLGVTAGGMTYYGGIVQLLTLAGAMFVAFLLPNTHQIVGLFHEPQGRVPDSGRPLLSSWITWRPSPWHACAIGILGAFGFFALARTSAFLYFNF